MLKQHAIEDVLQVEQRLALAADEPPGIIGCLEVQHLVAFCHFFLDGHLVAEIVQQGLEQGLGVLCGCTHGMIGNYFLRLRLFFIGLAKGELSFINGASTTMFFVSLVWRMLSMFCTVQ